MTHIRLTALTLSGILLSSCAAAPAEAGPAEPGIRPNVYEVAAEQGRERSPADTTGTLQVSGSAEVRVEPDRARVSFAVETEAATASEASEENARRMERVHGALRDLGASGLRLETHGYDVSPLYGRTDERGARRIEGYRARNHVRVIVDDISAVGRIVDAAIGAGANRATGLSFEASNTDDARLEALRRAVAKARSEAEAIAGALGAELGRPLEVNGGANTPGPVVQYRAAQEAMTMSAPDTPVEAGQQTVTASVTIRYRLGRTASGN